MKLLEQYLEAIIRNLPFKGREDIRKELRSLILDQVEARYGTNPGDDKLREIITAFGSPAEIANRYSGNTPIIPTGLSDLYRLIISILAGAMVIAFLVDHATTFLTEGHVRSELPTFLFSWIGDVFSSWITGVGAVTLIFIALGRLMPDVKCNPNDDWTPAELSGIELETDTPAHLECVLGMIFPAAVFIVSIFFPWFMTKAEFTFSLSGIPLGHHVEISAMRIYFFVIGFLCIAEIVLHFLCFREKTTPALFNVGRIALDASFSTIFALMVFDGHLYTQSTGWIGFKVVFTIIAVVSVAEAVLRLSKMIVRKAGKN